MPQAIAWAINAAYTAIAGSAAAGVTATVIKAISTVLFYAGAYAYQRSQAKKLEDAFTDAVPFQMTREPSPPTRVVYGRQRISGPVVFVHTEGTDNTKLHLVVALSDHELAEIESFYLNDEWVDAPVQEALGKYATKAYFNRHLGTTTQTADSDLVSQSGGKWTTNHRLRGIGYIYAQLLWDSDLFPTGLPNISAIVKGKPVYDPRTASTGWSANPALILRDYLTDTTFGLGFPTSEIDDTSFSAAASVCDEGVDVAAGSFARACDTDSGSKHIGVSDLSDIVVGLEVSGTGVPADSVIVAIHDHPGERFFTIDQACTATGSGVSLTFGDAHPRYRCHGVFDTDVEPATVIDEILASMAGQLVYVAGQWKVFAGADRPVACTLGPDDLAGPISLRTRDPLRDTANIVRGTYAEPADNWLARDYPEIRNSTYITEDQGQEIIRDMPFAWVHDAYQAQRLAKIALESARQDISVRAVFKLTALQAVPGDVVQLNFPDRYGWTNKKFMVTGWSFTVGDDGALAVVCELREYAAAIFDWSAEETTVDLAPNSDLPDPWTVQPPTSLALASAATLGADGTAVPVLTATWTAPDDQFVSSGGAIEVEFKLNSGGTWTQWGTLAGNVTRAEIRGLTAGLAYDVRVRAINGMGVRSAYATVTGHTVAGDTTAPSAPSDGALTAAGGPPKFLDSSNVEYFGCRVSWTDPADKDLACVEVKATTTDSDGATGSTWLHGTVTRVPPGRQYHDIYSLTLGAAYVRIRSVDISGNASAWQALGNANASAGIQAGDMAQQNKSDVKVSKVKIGDTSASSVRGLKALYCGTVVQTLTGGAASETFSVDLTNRGFSAKPSFGQVQIVGGSYIDAIEARYDFDHASNSATAAYVRVTMRDGSNLPAGDERFAFIFIEHD